MRSPALHPVPFPPRPQLPTCTLPAGPPSSGVRARSRPALCGPVDCSPPGLSAHGILRSRILEWVAISSSRAVFQTQASKPHLLSLPHWPVDPLPLGRFFTTCEASITTIKPAGLNASTSGPLADCLPRGSLSPSLPLVPTAPALTASRAVLTDLCAHWSSALEVCFSRVGPVWSWSCVLLGTLWAPEINEQAWAAG